MAWPVGYKLYEIRMRRSARRQLVKELTDCLYHLKIRTLIMAADIVRLASGTPFQNSEECTRVVFYKQPVPNLLAIALLR